MFIHFQLQWIGCYEVQTLLYWLDCPTRHLSTGSPSGFLRIVEPFSLAEWHIWMPCVLRDAHNATWQMVLYDAKNLHMLHISTYMLQCARQIWFGAGVSGVSAAFAADFLPADFFRSQHPILPSLSLRLATRRSNLPYARRSLSCRLKRSLELFIEFYQANPEISHAKCSLFKKAQPLTTLEVVVYWHRVIHSHARVKQSVMCMKNPRP